MVNNLEFAERLKTMMEYYGLTATALADSIAVQRSSISHLLSGRNKPSLDFVLKVLQKYPSVELYWLLNGKGHFPKDEEVIKTPTPFLKDIHLQKLEELNPSAKSNDEVEKIVIFYKNGTFKSYTP